MSVIGAYVDLERRTLREAEERAEADAQSCVVSPARVVGLRRHEQFWRLVEQKQQANRRVRKFERRG